MDTDRIEGTGREVAGKVQKAVGGVIGDDETQAKGLYNQAAGIAQDTLGKAKDIARDAAEHAPRLAGQFANQAADVGQRYYNQGSQVVSRQVGDQHLAAIMIAGATGYLLGWLIHGRR